MTEAEILSFQDIALRTSLAWREQVPLDFWDEADKGEITKTQQWKPALIAFLLSGMLVGTGGTANVNTLPLSYDSPTYRISPVNQRRHQSSLLIDTRERVAALRRYFSLNITDLTKVLRIERPTVYAWLREDAAPHPGNLKRLEKIYHLSRDWRTLSAVPTGRYIHEPFEDGRSLLDYLSAEELNEPAIRHAFTVIQSRLAQKKETSTARRRSVAEVAQLYGFASVPEHIQQQNFDEETNL